MTKKKAPKKGAGTEFASILQGGDAKILKNPETTKFPEAKNALSEVISGGGVEPVATKGLNIDFSRFPDDMQAPDYTTLPIWGLPKELQDIVEYVSYIYDTSRDYAVLSMMAAAATILGKRVSLTTGAYTNYCGLWCALVGSSAMGKTQPLSYFFQPIREMERESYEQYIHNVQTWQDDGCKGEKPKHYHHLLNNPTDESVLKELAINADMCWQTDELSTMFGAWGKYAKNATNITGNLLSIYQNNDVSVTRSGNDGLYLREPNLSIIGTIQPNVLRRCFSNSMNTGDGLLQRFLFAWPDERPIAYHQHTQKDKNKDNVWQNTIKKLSSIKYDMIESAEVCNAHFSFADNWTDKINTNYQGNDTMVAFVKKLDIQLCRWLAIVTALNNHATPTEDDVKYSFECMEYFRLNAEKVYCHLCGSDEQKSPTKKYLIQQLRAQYPNLNITQLAKSLGVSQQAISKTINQ